MIFSMNTIFLLFGVVIGMLTSILITILYFSKTKDNIERQLKKIFSRKATIISTVNPLDEIDL